MDFDGDKSALQRRMNTVAEGAARRRLALDGLMPSIGDRVIDIGCGGGHLVKEIAESVGDAGEVVGIDVSNDQLTAAREYCDGLENVDFAKADVTDLAYPDAAFSGAVSIQVLEYVEDIPKALSEIRRILKPNAKASLVNMLWDTFRFNGAETALNDRMMACWKAHCFHQMLAMDLPRLMIEAGFRGITQQPYTAYNTRKAPPFQGYSTCQTVAYFCSRRGMSESEVNDWLSQLERADREGRFGFVATTVRTVGTAI